MWVWAGISNAELAAVFQSKDSWESDFGVLQIHYNCQYFLQHIGLRATRPGEDNIPKQYISWLYPNALLALSQWNGQFVLLKYSKIQALL